MTSQNKEYLASYIRVTTAFGEKSLVISRQIALPASVQGRKVGDNMKERERTTELAMNGKHSLFLRDASCYLISNNLSYCIFVDLIDVSHILKNVQLLILSKYIQVQVLT